MKLDDTDDGPADEASLRVGVQREVSEELVIRVQLPDRVRISKQKVYTCIQSFIAVLAVGNIVEVNR